MFDWFVNDDDIVPMVPPGYRHVGMLYQFDGSGRPKPGIESMGLGLAEVGRPTMSEAEFDRLRSTLLQQSAALRSAIRTESIGATVLGWLFLSVSDHRLNAYIAKIAAKASA